MFDQNTINLIHDYLVSLMVENRLKYKQAAEGSDEQNQAGINHNAVVFVKRSLDKAFPESESNMLERISPTLTEAKRDSIKRHFVENPDYSI
jgi:hypothetical protein